MGLAVAGPVALATAHGGGFRSGRGRGVPGILGPRFLRCAPWSAVVLRDWGLPDPALRILKPASDRRLTVVLERCPRLPPSCSFPGIRAGTGAWS